MPTPSAGSAATAPALALTAGRNTLAGFLLSGVLLSFIGAILPSWRYHVTSDYRGAGACFLFLNIGLLGGTRAAAALVRCTSLTRILTTGAILAAAAFILFAFTLPPADPSWRYAGSALLGGGAGLVTTALLYASSSLYDRDRAGTLNFAGTAFGIGCVATALLIAGTYFVYTIRSILLIFAVLTAGFAVAFSRRDLAGVRLPPAEPLRHVLADFRSAAVVLFTLLLFFQFGNEWSIGGWLPLLLIQRLGVSPETSLILLALFWVALLAGRFAVQRLLTRLPRGRFLLGSMLAPVFGCVILTFTNNLFGATVAILSMGLGFAPIFPLVAEKISARFPAYHPMVFSGLFSFAFTGGLLAPWMIGFMARAWGIRAVMAVLLPGTFMVFLLMLLILLETRLSEGQSG